MKKILFVCTGNTCRSPMAEAIFMDMLNKKNIKDIQAESCGIAAVEGQPISENAIKALQNMDITPHEHKSRQFKDEFLQQYNLILTMTETQKQYIGQHGNVFTLAELTSTKDIPDPYGKSIEEYQAAAHSIHKSCEILLDIFN